MYRKVKQLANANIWWEWQEGPDWCSLLHGLLPLKHNMIYEKD